LSYGRKALGVPMNLEEIADGANSQSSAAHERGFPMDARDELTECVLRQLERQPGAQRNFAARRHGHGNGAELRRVDITIGSAESDLVPGVKRLAAELEAVCLTE